MANNDALEAKKAVDDIVETFKQHNAVVAEGASILKNYSTVLVQLPTEVREMLGTFSTLLTKTREQEAEMQKAIQQTAKYTAEIEKLKLAEAKLNEQKTKNKVLTVQERVDNAQILTQEKQKALAVSSVANAYTKLNAERTIAKNKLRDLIASEQASNAEIRKAQREFDVLDQRVRKAERAVNDFSKSVGNYKTALSGVSNLMGAFGIATGLYLAVDVVKNIYETTKALQSMDLALKMVSGSDLEFAKNKKFVSEAAEKWGLEIKSLTQTYNQFYTASKGLLSDQSIKTTFEGIAKAGSVMGLSLENQQAAFYAIDQMMSKGTVTAEELKKQLGNAMPGAIKAAAMAYMELHPAIKNIQEAEKELYADMKKGAIDSATYVPLIAKNFQVLYGIEALDSVHTMQAAQNKLLNSWTRWVGGLSSGGSGLKLIVSTMEFLAKHLGTVTSVLSFSIAGWLAYKTAVMLANVQARLLLLTTAQSTTATATQTTVTGFQTSAQIANATATNVATTAWQRFNVALKANVLGLIVIALTAVLYLFDKFSKTAIELNDELKQVNSTFIVNREIVTAANIELKNAIGEYENLTKKAKALGGETKLTTEEQKKLKDVTALLAKEMPNAVTALDKYGNALKLNTVLLKEYLKNKEKIAEVERLEAVSAEKENIKRLEHDVNLKKSRLNDYGRFLSAEEAAKSLGYAKDEKKLSISENELILAKARLRSLQDTTQAQKDATQATEADTEEVIQNVAWYDEKIKKLKESIDLLTDKTGKEGKDLQKKIADLQAIRDKIAGEEGKGRGKKAESSQQINIQDKLLKEEFDMAIRMLEVARKFQEEIFNDEEKTYAERLAAREIYSKTTLDLIDAQNNREIRIEKDKAEQLLKNQTEARDKDLKSNATNVKNGFADKRIEIENRYAENVKTINYNLAQALYKIDLDYLGKNHDLQEQDFAFFEKIQKEKQRLTKETANIYFEMAQERRLKDANDESRSLTQRQASFESWKDMAEAQLFFDEALAKSNSNQSPEALAKITAEFDKLRNSIKETLSPLQKFAKETKGWLEGFTSSFIANAGLSQTFKFFEDDFFTNIDKAFTDGLISKEEKFAAYFNAIAEMGQEAYNFLSQMSQANFEDQKQKLQAERDTALLYAGDSATGRAEIERQYQKEQKRINKQEAKAKKEMAKFNIFIDTAQAIVAFLAKGNIGASIAAGVIGAFELAAVSAKDTPQYWRGTDNAKEGLAWTQEKGREVILDNRRRLKSIGSDSGATLTKMSAGDKVLTAEQSMQYFYEEYNKLLNTNNISPFSSTLRGTPLLSARQTESQGMSDNQVEKIVSAIENKVEYRSSFDKSGFREFVSKGTVETENQNNRSQGIGKNV